MEEYSIKDNKEELIYNSKIEVEKYNIINVPVNKDILSVHIKVKTLNGHIIDKSQEQWLSVLNVPSEL